MIGLSAILKVGNENSGNHGHSGRPGERGGSGDGDGGSSDAVENLQKILGDNLNIKDIDSEVVQSHLKELNKFSPDILKGLKEKNISFYIANKSVPYLDDNKYLLKEHPRGWPAGYTWKNVDGCYQPGKNQVCIGAGRSGSSNLVGHETGHAIYREILSQDQRREMMEINKEYRFSLNKYFQQSGTDGMGIHRGTNEMFSEAVASVMKHGKIVSGNNFSNNQECCDKLTEKIKSWKIL